MTGFVPMLSVDLAIALSCIAGLAVLLVFVGLHQVAHKEVDLAERLGDPEPVTAPSRWCGNLSIARDGRHLLYASFEETSTVRRVSFDPVSERVAGKPVSILSGSLLVREIGPSPDGKWVAFSSRGVQEDIFVISSDGSSLRQLTRTERAHAAGHVLHAGDGGERGANDHQRAHVRPQRSVPARGGPRCIPVGAEPPAHHSVLRAATSGQCVPGRDGP